MRSVILGAITFLLTSLVNAQAPDTDDFSCHGHSTMQMLVRMLSKDVLAEFGEDDTRDLLNRLEPSFDLILVKGKNEQTGELACAARLMVSMENINQKTVTERLANAYRNNALLAAAGHPVQDENILKPTGFGEGNAYWDDVYYSIQPTSDGADYVITIDKGQGYKNWFKAMVKYGGLEITDEEVAITQAKNERWENEAGGEAAAPAPVPAAPTSSTPPKPSFDCSKASSANEKLICSDAELSTLDAELGAIYQQAKGKAADPAAFKKSTVEAWKWREAHCQNKQCLVDWYAQRKESLLSNAQ